ncbi:MAG TPA: ATP-binding cassette domain-containing protein [Candidatus Dormibacteraeota bacterium]|nr:ATP-binding cassette domain-containing protein [Candidatus Dormibacteraeota bacterium]
MRARVEIRGLWVSHRALHRNGLRRGEPRWALRDLSLVVAAGEQLGVVGANGAGKSTLLQAIAGVFPPTRGDVRTHGRVASVGGEWSTLHRDLSGDEGLLFEGVVAGLSRRELRRRRDAIAEFAELPDGVLSAPLFTYSAGMQARLGIALALHADLDVLLVDEVLAAGDAPFREKCMDRIDQIRAGGAAVVIVSHDLDLVRERCDRALLLDAGVMRFLGSPREAVALHRGSTAAGIPAAAPAVAGSRRRTGALR